MDLKEPPKLNVVQLELPGLQNVPAMLRNLANDIESGKYGDWQEAACVLNYENGFSVFGWGLTTPADACMILAAGVQRFTNTLVRKCDD